MRKIIIVTTLILSFFSVIKLSAQGVKIAPVAGAPVGSAMLEVESTNKGLLIPRLSLSARNVAAPVVAPDNSLLVFNTNTAGTIPFDVSPGFYYWNSALSEWVRVTDGTTIVADDQNIDSLTLNSTLLTTYIEDGTSASIDLLSLASDANFYNTIRDSLILDSNFTDSLQSIIVNNNTFIDSLYITISDSLLLDTAWLSAVQDSVNTDDQNIDSIILAQTILSVFIENGASASTDLIGLATDSAFYQAILDSLLGDSKFTNSIDSLLLSDSTFIDGIIDSLLTNNYFKDSLFSFNRDSLLSDQLFRDSIYSLIADSLLSDSSWLAVLADSIDTDVDSAILSGDTLINIYEDGKVISIDVSSLKDSSEWVDGSLVSLTPGNIYARKALANGDVVIIDTAGRLGIGTGTPVYSLQTEGTNSDASFNGVRVGKGEGDITSNTALGSGALQNNTSGDNNVGVGFNSLSNNTTGRNNISVGRGALSSNTTGQNNVGVGANALTDNITGNNNVALGLAALANSTKGNSNVSLGSYSMQYNDSGSANIAIGYVSLRNNISGIDNIAIGYNALVNNTIGNSNTVIGRSAGRTLVDGDNNTIMGYNTSLGLTRGSNNTIIGAFVTLGGADSSVNNNIILADGQGNQRVRVNNTGDVGLGINYPTHRLDVNGETRIRTINDTNDVGGILIANDSGVIMNIPYNTLLAKINDSSEWVDGAAVGLTPGNIYARKALANGDTIVASISGNFGIGTDNPNQLLHVYGNAVNQIAHLETNTPFTFLRFSALGDTSQVNGIANAGSDNMVVYTSGAERMRVSQGGNVGIGTNTPQDLLTIQRNADTVTQLSITNTNNSANAASVMYLGGQLNSDYGYFGLHPNLFSSPDAADQLVLLTGSTVANGLRLATQNQDIYLSTGGFSGGASNRLTVSGATGNVGINSNTPTHRLDVNGEARIRLITDTTDISNILTSNASGVIQKLPYDSLVNSFRDSIEDADWLTTSNNSKAISINDTIWTRGFVGINTNNPTAHLEVNGNIKLSPNRHVNLAGGRLRHSNLDGNDLIIESLDDVFIDIDRNNDGNNEKIYFTQDSLADTLMVIQGTVLGTPRVGIGTASPVTTLHVHSDQINPIVLQNSQYAKENTALQSFIEFKDSLGDTYAYVGEGSSGKKVSLVGHHNYSVLLASYSGNTALTERSTIGVNENGEAEITFDTKTVERMRIDSNGNVGIGTSTPSQRLTVSGNSLVTGQSDASSFVSNIGTGPSGAGHYNLNSGGLARSIIGLTVNEGGANSGSNFFIARYDDAGSYLGNYLYGQRSNGFVVVGNTTATEQLNVGGNVKADTFFSLANTYPDYVFENYFEEKSEINPTYKFKSEKFIKENRHLPGVTPINKLDVINQKYKVDVSSTSIKNLEKIEELYLHLIEMNKKNEELSNQNQDLKEKLLLLEERLIKLENKKD